MTGFGEKLPHCRINGKGLHERPCRSPDCGGLSPIGPFRRAPQLARQLELRVSNAPLAGWSGWLRWRLRLGGFFWRVTGFGV